MEENQMFKVKDENGMEKNAELLSAFDMDDKNYIIYSIDNGEEMANIYAAELIEDENGETDMKEIDDADIKNKITDIIDGIMNK